MPYCKICKTEKGLDNFTIRKVNGRPRCQCKECVKILNKTKWKIDIKRKQSRQKLYGQANKERIKESQKKSILLATERRQSSLEYKICEVCLKAKLLRAFHVYRKKCIDCCNQNRNVIRRESYKNTWSSEIRERRKHLATAKALEKRRLKKQAEENEIRIKLNESYELRKILLAILLPIYLEKRLQRQKRDAEKRQLRKFYEMTKTANNYSSKDQRDIKPFDLWKIAKKQKMRCALTGVKLTSSNISLDHIVPRNKGGKNVVTNLQLVDYDINMMKLDILEKDFIEKCRLIVENAKSKGLIS